MFNLFVLVLIALAVHQLTSWEPPEPLRRLWSTVGISLYVLIYAALFGAGIVTFLTFRR